VRPWSRIASLTGLVASALVAVGAPGLAGPGVNETLSTGSWEVPANVSCVTFTVTGGGGGTGSNLEADPGAPGGLGALASATFEVSGTLDIVVGGAGHDGTELSASQGAGGSPGGGGDAPGEIVGGTFPVGGGGGGGLSSVMAAGGETLIVAGGGGGGGTGGIDDVGLVDGGRGGDGNGQPSTDGAPAFGAAGQQLPGLGGHQGSFDALGGAGGVGTDANGTAGADGAPFAGGDGGEVGALYPSRVGGGGGGGGHIGGGGGGGGGDQGDAAGNGGGGAGSSFIAGGGIAPLLATASVAGEGVVTASYAPGDTSCVTDVVHETLSTGTWDVPAGVVCATFTVGGAAGGGGAQLALFADSGGNYGDPGAFGGFGGLVTGSLPVSGQYDVVVGTPGKSGQAGVASAGASGSPGGGAGAAFLDPNTQWTWGGGGGGGASSVGQGGAALLVAGGGGGAGAGGVGVAGVVDGGDGGSTQGGNGARGYDGVGTDDGGGNVQEPGQGGEPGLTGGFGGAGGAGTDDDGEVGANGAAGQGGAGGAAGDQFQILVGGGGGGGGAFGGGGGGGGGDQGVLAGSGGGGAGSSFAAPTVIGPTLATSVLPGHGFVDVAYVVGDTSCAEPDLTIQGGDSQSVAVNGDFAPLVVKVLDALGAPIVGHTVTFTAPASGPSGTFADTGNNVDTDVTSASGIATSSALTANDIPGSFTVTAQGSPVVTFSLTITAAGGTPAAPITVIVADPSRLTG
jgi:hypothetical protein